jgi:hypothetical protein
MTRSLRRIRAIFIATAIVISNSGFVNLIRYIKVDAGSVSTTQTTSLTPTAHDATVNNTDQLGDWVGQTIAGVHNDGRASTPIDFSTTHNWG